MKIIPVVEMQTRLSELLSRFPNEVIQVTYQGTAVVAVLPQESYQTFRAHIATLQTATPVTFEKTRASLTEAQRLFHSYRNRLAPRLQRSEGRINIIEVTRRKQRVGAILAWDDWRSLAGEQREEREPLKRRDHTLTIVATRNHLLKLVEQFADEEQHGIFAPITITKQGTPVMAIVPWGWFERVTHFLRRQIVPFTRMRPDGSLIISSNQVDAHVSRERETLPEHIGELSLLWSRFHQAASTIAVHISRLTDPDPSALLSLDHGCAELEDQCMKAQQMAQELLIRIQVLPIHDAIMRHSSPLPDGMDEQALWDVEALARTTYEQALATGALKSAAWDATRKACLAWALQRSWSRGQSSLSRDVELLVEDILVQVREMVMRRRMGVADGEEEM